MSLIDQYFSKVPEYYDTMYMDGYTPAQILHSVKCGMYKKHMERNQQRNAEKDVRSVLESALHSMFKGLK